MSKCLQCEKLDKDCRCCIFAGHTAAAAQGEDEPPHPYDALFRAIAAATKIAGGCIAVSVKQFVQTLASGGYTVNRVPTTIPTSESIDTQEFRSLLHTYFDEHRAVDSYKIREAFAALIDHIHAWHAAGVEKTRAADDFNGRCCHIGDASGTMAPFLDMDKPWSDEKMAEFDAILAELEIDQGTSDKQHCDSCVPVKTGGRLG